MTTSHSHTPTDAHRAGLEPDMPRARAGLPVDSRLDAPHPLRTEVRSSIVDTSPLPSPERDLHFESLSADPQPSANEAEERWLAAEQLRRQAQQISALLAERQAHLDRREARLHAQEAELENARRAGRLWLVEQHAALEARSLSLTAQERLVAEQMSQVAAAEAYQESLRRELDERHAQLVRESDRQLEALRGECQDIDTAAPSPEVEQLAQGWTSLAQARQQLAARRERIVARLRRSRERLLIRARQLARQLRRRQETLRLQSDALLKRRTEMEQLRFELVGKQRELLELRVTVEHALAEFGRQVPHESQAEILSATRARIAAQYQQARAELDAQEQILSELRAQITAGYEQLSDRQQEIIRLTRQRRLHIARQAAEAATRQKRPPAA